MFSGIWTRWVPRADVSVRLAGRSGSPSQPSIPAVSAWIQLSAGIRESTPGPERYASIASARPSWSGDGVSAGGTCTSSTRRSSPARSSAWRYGPGSGIHSSTSGRSAIEACPPSRDGSLERMRALVIGASGQVGAVLLRVLAARDHEAVGTWAHRAYPGLVPLDLADTGALERLLGEHRPDWVLCPAALSHVDYCEEHPEEAFAVNVHTPLAAARATARAGAGFVYYSSDYIFDGVGGPFVEEAPPHPLGVYGRSKAEGEAAVLSALARALVVRTSVV